MFFELAGPARFVLPVRLAPASHGDLIEARLRDGESSPSGTSSNSNTPRVIGSAGSTSGFPPGLPAPGKEPLRFHLLDDDLEGQVLVLRNGDRAAHCLARSEAAGQPGTEPLAELGRIGQSLPHPGPGSPQDDALLDLVGARPPGESLLVLIGNLLVAHRYAWLIRKCNP